MPLAGCAPAPPARPNLLVFVVDTLRADALGSYGRADADTPHTDRLAREGIVFERAFSTSSWTRPAMASLLTARLPERHGVERRRAVLAPDVPRLPTWLAAAGYDTALVTANPQIGSFFGFAGGFDTIVELYGRRRSGPVRGTELVARGSEVAARCVAWLENAERPFALVALAIDPHAPYAAPARFRPPESAPPRAHYQAEVRAVDSAFGTVLGALEAAGTLEDTWIVFTSDHGEEFGEYGRTGHGASLVDESLHVPLLIRPPARAAQRGVRISDPVQLVDVAPTLLEAAGLEPPDGLDGRSLLSADAEPRIVRASVVTPRGTLRAARADPWKLLLGPRPGDRSLFDLRVGEHAGVDVALTPGADAAGQALARALETPEGCDPEPGRPTVRLRSLAARCAPASGRLALPTDVEEGLRALGYVTD